MQRCCISIAAELQSGGGEAVARGLSKPEKAERLPAVYVVALIMRFVGSRLAAVSPCRSKVECFFFLWVGCGAGYAMQKQASSLLQTATTTVSGVLTTL